MRLIPLVLAAATLATPFAGGTAAAEHCVDRHPLNEICRAVLPARCWWGDHGIWCEYDR